MGKSGVTYRHCLIRNKSKETHKPPQTTSKRRCPVFFCGKQTTPTRISPRCKDGQRDRVDGDVVEGPSHLNEVVDGDGLEAVAVGWSVLSAFTHDVLERFELGDAVVVVDHQNHGTTTKTR